VYFQEITTGSSTSRIQVKTNNGDRALLKQGQGVNLPPFKQLSVYARVGLGDDRGRAARRRWRLHRQPHRGNVNATPTPQDYTHAAVTVSNASIQLRAATARGATSASRSERDGGYLHQTPRAVRLWQQRSPQARARQSWSRPSRRLAR